jgi:C-terminal processing protease CtpA/Prc
MRPEAKTYLNEALDSIQTHSVRREQLNWPALRRQATDMAATAHTPAETYPAIRRTLELLGDRHSMFLEPETVRRRREGKLVHLGLQAVHPTGVVGVVYPGSAAEQAGIHAGDRLATINGRAISTFTQDEMYTVLQQPQATLTLTPADGGTVRSVSLEAAPFVLTRQPKGHRLAGNLGYLEIPNSVGGETSRPYATRAHQVIRTIDQTRAAGWIIDLRTNTGGALYPMLAAVGPIAGEGELLGFVAPGERQSAYYRQGRAWLEGVEISTVEVEEWYTLKHPGVSVAVLISQLTASSGEFTALAFRGRPHTRSFGEPTRGVPTGNDVEELSDGAWIALTTVLGTDQTGQTYDAPLLPDEPVLIEWTKLSTNEDPVLQAAVGWLHAESHPS